MILSAKAGTGRNNTLSFNTILFNVTVARLLNASFLLQQSSWKGGLVHSRQHMDGLSKDTWTNLKQNKKLTRNQFWRVNLLQP